MVPFALTIFSVPFVGAWIRGEYGKVITIVLGDILLWIVLEDIFWHIEQVPPKWVNSTEWVNWVLSGFYIPLTTIWIPTVYIILIASSITLYIVGFSQD
jgi:hypothetical protein